MPYDGLIYDHFGEPAGIPWDLYMEYKDNEPLYTQMNRPVPQHANVVKEPDGSIWQYVFSYSDPYYYSYKTQVGSPAGGDLPDPTLYNPPINYPTPAPSDPVTLPDPAEIPTTPVSTNIPLDPTRPLEPLPDTTGGGSALLGIGALALGALALSGIGRKRTKSTKRARRK